MRARVVPINEIVARNSLRAEDHVPRSPQELLDEKLDRIRTINNETKDKLKEKETLVRAAKEMMDDMGIELRKTPNGAVGTLTPTGGRRSVDYDKLEKLLDQDAKDAIGFKFGEPGASLTVK